MLLTKLVLYTACYNNQETQCIVRNSMLANKLSKCKYWMLNFFRMKWCVLVFMFN